jgi:hypothetical protein
LVADAIASVVELSQSEAIVVEARARTMAAS